MDDVEVRAARGGDLEAVALLRWQWGLETGAEPTVTQEDFVAAFVAWAHEHVASHACTLLARGDRVIGMAWLAEVPRVPSARSLARATGDVQCVYVVPEERGRGWAGRLVRHVLADAGDRGLERVTVHSSAAAVPVYARAGFAADPQLLQAAPSPR